MEFMEGVGVTDIAKQEELGIDRADVAHLVSLRLFPPYVVLSFNEHSAAFLPEDQLS
jgi:hypothetical protein